ncbi:hypothetical protein ACEPPN_010494 [Leptodophora sp. 'Broadleaf-Isolate-01']
MSFNNFLPPGWGVEWPAFPSIIPPPPPVLPTTTQLPISIPIPSPAPTGVLTSTSTPPPTPTDFTVTLPFPPPGSTTVTSLVTIQPTSITTITTTTIPTNVISTVTETSTTLSISVTPLTNPAATSAIAGQSSLLRSNATLSRTNITVSLVLGTLSLLLLAALLTIFLLYLRKRRKGPREDDESPPFTSLAPRPAPDFAARRGFGATSVSVPNLPPSHMRETSLSMGPRGGTADSNARAVAAGLSVAGTAGVGLGVGAGVGVGAGPSVSTPRRVLFRSSSAPVEAPTPPPRIPPFKGLGLPSMSLFGRSLGGTLSPTPKGKEKEKEVGTPSPRPATASGAGGAGAGMGPRPSVERLGLVRQSSMPLYHEALRDQAEMEREASVRLQAEGLGLPVIAVQRSADDGEEINTVSRTSGESLGSEMFEEGMGKSGDEKASEEGGREEESDSSGDRDRERERKAGLGLGVGGAGNGEDNGRAGILHSTRASSGVFPEGERDVERDVPERSEKDVYS